MWGGTNVIGVYVTRVSSRIGATQRWHLVWRVSSHFFAVEIATITGFSFSFFCHVDSMIGTSGEQSSACTFLISVFARITCPNAIHTVLSKTRSRRLHYLLNIFLSETLAISLGLIAQLNNGRN